MDALVDLHVSSLPKDPRLQLRQDVYVWDGVEYPQGAPYYQWGSYIKLVRGPVSTYPRRRMPPNVAMNIEEMTRLTILGEPLDRFEAEASGDDVDWAGASLAELLSTLLPEDQDWVACLLMEADQIHEVYHGDAPFFLERLGRSLMRGGDRLGFCVFHPWIGSST